MSSWEMGRPETISCKVAQELAIEQRVEFTGPMESHETIRLIGGSRLLTHPSYDDSGSQSLRRWLREFRC